jgi:hypothetical protein
VPPTPELLAEWAQTLDVALYSGVAQQRKALIRKLVKELTVMSRDEIIPTYRVPALVRAPGSQVDQRGVEPLTSPVRAGHEWFTVMHRGVRLDTPAQGTERFHDPTPYTERHLSRV